jgi:uncharacterized protein
MERRDVELIQQYVTQDDQLRTVYQQHQELKRKLETFRSKLYLTAQEELEKKRIQKLKLASKDRIMEILHRHQHQVAR